jgi:transposase InsO family protein
MLFVDNDDHARIGFTQMHQVEQTPSPVAFLCNVFAYYGRLGVSAQRLLTDNGSAFRSRALQALCEELGSRHKFTQAYRFQTISKGERFIQNALHEWAYRIAHYHSSERTAMLAMW